MVTVQVALRVVFGASGTIFLALTGYIVQSSLILRREGRQLQRRHREDHRNAYLDIVWGKIERGEEVPEPPSWWD